MYNKLVIHLGGVIDNRLAAWGINNGISIALSIADELVEEGYIRRSLLPHTEEVGVTTDNGW